MTIEDRIDSGKDKLTGKANQVVGKARGDKDQELRGHGQELKGDLKDVGTDIKGDLKDVGTDMKDAMDRRDSVS